MMSLCLWNSWVTVHCSVVLHVCFLISAASHSLKLIWNKNSGCWHFSFHCTWSNLFENALPFYWCVVKEWCLKNCNYWKQHGKWQARLLQQLSLQTQKCKKCVFTACPIKKNPGLWLPVEKIKKHKYWNLIIYVWLSYFFQNVITVYYIF